MITVNALHEKDKNLSKRKKNDDGVDVRI